MLPHSPGVYRFLDSGGTVIYVGKAKDLKNRVSQYFRPNGLNRKTQVMVSKIADIQHTVVGSSCWRTTSSSSSSPATTFS